MAEKPKGPEDCPSCRQASRRKFLKQAAAGAAGMVLLGAMQACKPDDPEIKAGTLAELEEKGFLDPVFNGDRIFVMRMEEELICYSLICTHKKCTVKWKAELEEFHCPCHEGKYDKEGFVIAGPPPDPMRQFKVEMREQEIWVLNQLV